MWLHVLRKCYQCMNYVRVPLCIFITTNFFIQILFIHYKDIMASIWLWLVEAPYVIVCVNELISSKMLSIGLCILWISLHSILTIGLCITAFYQLRTKMMIRETLHTIVWWLCVPCSTANKRAMFIASFNCF